MAKKSTSKLFPSTEDVEKKETPIVDVDLDISAIRKKRVRVNNDNDRIIELNISDLNIMNRLEVAYDKLNKMMDEVYKEVKTPENPDDMSDDETAEIQKALAEIDKRMREQVDYIFDYPVSEACLYGGSMWDPIEGEFRYEHIITALLGLYENNLNSEFEKMKSRVDGKLQDHKKAVSKYHR